MTDGADMGRHRTLATALAGLFDIPVQTAWADATIRANAEFPQEDAACAGMLPTRRTEFLAGRRALRAALQGLGQAAVAIPVGPLRAPVLPAGVVASLTHSGPDCLAVAARSDICAGLGIDLEPATPLESGLWDTICTAGERAALDTLPIVARGLAVKRIFCVKEAVYKAQFTLTGALLNFDEVDVAIDGEAFTAAFRSPPRGLAAPILRGRITETPAGYLAALAIPHGTL